MTDKTDSKPLYKMFSNVPPRYDLMNRLLTLRLDELWRKKAARKCLQGSPHRILDLCTGTGDLALHIARYANGQHIELTGLDFSESMLEIAKSKAKTKGRDIDFIHGDVSALPFPDNHFNTIGIGFAFRNLTFKNPKTGVYMGEILRVLKTGGRFIIIETSQPEKRWINRLFHFYMRYIVSKLGGRISGHRGAYHYLAYSAINYYSILEMKQFLERNHFKGFAAHSLLGGIASIYEVSK